MGEGGPGARPTRSTSPLQVPPGPQARRTRGIHTANSDTAGSGLCPARQALHGAGHGSLRGGWAMPVLLGISKASTRERARSGSRCGPPPPVIVWHRSPPQYLCHALDAPRGFVLVLGSCPDGDEVGPFKEPSVQMLVSRRSHRAFSRSVKSFLFLNFRVRAFFR